MSETVLIGKCRNKPEWIKRAIRNARARERRWAKKYKCSIEKARQMIAEVMENRAQGRPS